MIHQRPAIAIGRRHAGALLAGLLAGVTALAAPGVGHAGRGGAILPANETTTEYRMRARGGAAYRNYREVALRQGAQAAEAFAGLDPFVQNTYGQPVPIIGVSAGTQSGRVSTASGGVTADKALSDYLQGRGPAPAGVTATLDAARQGQRPAARPGADPVFMHQTLLRQPPAQAASQLVATAKELLPKRSDASLVARHTKNLRDLLALGLRMPGSWQRTAGDEGALVLAKRGAQGELRITYLPGNALSFRVERTDLRQGFNVLLQSQGNAPGGRAPALNLASSELGVAQGAGAPRFVPLQGDVGWVGLPVSSSFHSAFGL